jgi:hypothetical protein
MLQLSVTKLVPVVTAQIHNQSLLGDRINLGTEVPWSPSHWRTYAISDYVNRHTQQHILLISSSTIQRKCVFELRLRYGGARGTTSVAVGGPQLGRHSAMTRHSARATLSQAQH